MTAGREALTMPNLDDGLDDFAPRHGAGQGAAVSAPDARAVDRISAFPSREAASDLQLNMKGPRPVIERFKTMCREDRRSYHAMLEILMNHFEGNAR